jgi:hypothetical protein
MTLAHRGERGTSNLSRRVRKLEARLTNITGLVARSDEWFAFWGDKIERLIAGEPPERIGRIPLEVIDQMREQPCSGERRSPEF